VEESLRGRVILKNLLTRKEFSPGLFFHVKDALCSREGCHQRVDDAACEDNKEHLKFILF
jgi:hypothetical protein